MMNNGMFQPPIDTPRTEVTCSGINFSFLKSQNAEMPQIDAPPTTDVAKKKRGRPPKKESDIIKASGDVITDTLNSYQETNSLIKETIGEVDTLTLELKNELDQVRSSKTLKNRYGYIGDLSENIGSLLNTKIQAIKELNNCISKANDMDYKRQKDINMANSQDVDQQIFDMYNAFVNTPVNSGSAQMSIGPSTSQMSLQGADGIVRVDRDNQLDIGFQNFQQNMTPAQHLMIMEDSVKDVIVYDEATGQKYFDKVDKNGNSVPNLDRKDPMFLEDYTISADHTVARNVNLNDVIPVIRVNAGKSNFNEY